MSRALTTAEFTHKAFIVHNGYYTYGNVNYVKAKIKVCITCKTHGAFWQEPNHHLSGHGCKDCGIIMASAKTSSNVEDFIQKANIAHTNTYNYSQVIYKNAKSKVQIICSIHGIFHQTPDDHLHGRGCMKCRNITIGSKLRKSNEQFIKDAIEVHGGLYKYDLVYYTGAHTKIDILCNRCNKKFGQTPTSHLGGSGCPSCNRIDFRRSYPSGEVTLYYLYKIGITSTSITTRYKNEHITFEVLFTKIYKEYEEAYKYEQLIIETFKKFLYIGGKIMTNTKNSEVFTKDILRKHL